MGQRDRHQFGDWSGRDCIQSENVLDNPVFRRMRELRQLSLVRHIHVGAEHTRWEHLVHTYDVARRFSRRLLSTPVFKLYMDSTAQRQLLGTALLHDLNQFPYMHYLQECLPREIDDRWILTRLFDITSVDPAAIFTPFDLTLDNFCDYAYKSHRMQSSLSGQIISSMINSAADIDKMSYITLDSLHTGVRFGDGLEIDTLARLSSIDWIEGDLVHLVFDERAIPALSVFLTARSSMYQSVYWHRINRSVMAMIMEDYTHAASLHGDELDFLSCFIEANLVRGEHTAIGWLNDCLSARTGSPGVSADIDVDRSRIYRRIITVKPETRFTLS